VTSRDDSLCWWPTWKVATEIRARQLSAREYLDALLDRVERFGGGLGLVVTVDDRAAQWAREADDATVRGTRLGPLHGVAMTVKDSLATEGLRSTAGAPATSGYLPRRDADAVAALRRAGAIIFGKTNLAENCLDIQSANGVFGAARNPWDPAFTTGGSSGGSAGAVSAGFTPLELGSDIAGSIRIPAACCGTLGHKPSFGIVPMAGHLPPVLPEPDMAVIGPIGRCTRDLDTALSVIAAPSSWDQQAWRLELPPPRTPRRIAAWFDDPYCPVDDEVRAALEYAADVLAGAGFQVERTAPAGIELAASDDVARRLLAPAALHHYTAAEIELVAAGQMPTRGELGADFVAQRQRDAIAAQARRHRLRDRWREFFASYDAILLPVMPNLVIEHDERPFADRRIVVNGQERPYWHQIAWACLTGITYLPSTVVPLRLDSRGLPIGIAVAGPYLADRSTLALAGVLADLLPPIGSPDLARAVSASGQEALPILEGLPR
jgi:amidase